MRDGSSAELLGTARASRGPSARIIATAAEHIPALASPGREQLRQGAAPSGSEASRCGLTKDRLVQLDVCQVTRQASVLLLKIVQAFRLVRPHAAALALPSLVGLLGHAKPGHHLGYGLRLSQPNPCLAEIPNDLLRREVLPSWQRLPPWFAPSEVRSLKVVALIRGTSDFPPTVRGNRCRLAATIGAIRPVTLTGSRWGVNVLPHAAFGQCRT
jgi:hypothetical protein